MIPNKKLTKEETTEEETIGKEIIKEEIITREEIMLYLNKYKLNTQPNPFFFLDQLKIWSKKGNIKIMENNDEQIYPSTPKDETNNFPDFIIHDGTKLIIKKNMNNFIGVEHTKVNPYYLFTNKFGIKEDPIRNLYLKNTKINDQIGLEITNLNKNLNKKILIEQIKKAIINKNEKCYLTKNIILWLEIDIKFDFIIKINDNWEKIYVNKGKEFKWNKIIIENSLIFNLMSYIDSELKKDETYKWFQKFPMILISFEIYQLPNLKTSIIASPLAKIEKTSLDKLENIKDWDITWPFKIKEINK